MVTTLLKDGHRRNRYLQIAPDSSPPRRAEYPSSLNLLFRAYSRYVRANNDNILSVHGPRKLQNLWVRMRLNLRAGLTRVDEPFLAVALSHVIDAFTAYATNATGNHRAWLDLSRTERNRRFTAGC